MRIVLIHNPKAGDREHTKKQLIASLATFGHQTFYKSTTNRGWKKALRKPVDLVIAAGGDGTVPKTAWEIMGSGIPLTILPLGTANNLARNLGFAASPDEILAHLHHGKTRPFDVGIARGDCRKRYFLEAAVVRRCILMLRRGGARKTIRRTAARLKTPSGRLR